MYFATSDGARFKYPHPNLFPATTVSALQCQSHENPPMTSDTTSWSGTLVLASASPRRHAFLRALGLPVQLHPANVDESPLPNETPDCMTLRLASLKAETARRDLPSEPPAEPALLLGLDTTVVHAGDILGKPKDALEAESFLRRLRTGPHEVCTGYCLINLQTGRRRTGVHVSRLTMRNYTDAEIDRYVRTGDPFDKAGGYALQDRDFNPIARLDGCAASVMGMPVHDLLHLLRDEAGWPVSRDFGAVCVRLTGRACCQTS